MIVFTIRLRDWRIHWAKQYKLRRLDFGPFSICVDWKFD